MNMENKNAIPKKFLYFELVGVPGSGKTTIASALEKKFLGEKRIVAAGFDFLKFNKFGRRVYSVLYAFRNAESMSALAGLIILFFRLLPYWGAGIADFRFVFTRHLVRNFLVRKTEAEIYIFDDGTVNRFFVASAGKVIGIDLKNIFRKLMPFELGFPIVISVETPIETAVSRVLKDSPEGREFMFEMEKKEMRAFYEEQLGNQERIINVLKKGIDSGILLLRVDGTLPPEENAKRIIAEINKSRTFPQG